MGVFSLSVAGASFFITVLQKSYLG